MPNYIMSNLLRKYRYDGKRFWFKHSDAIWRTVSAGNMTLFLMYHLNIPRKEAVRVRDSLKTASKKINDPVWAETVKWLDFTRGRALYVFLDKVEFCDPYTGRSKRSMKVSDFNEKLMKEFPNKGQITEGYPLAFLGV
jgi:hypothetical protein